MSSQEADTVTAVTALICIVIIVAIACYTGHDDTLVKMGVAAVAGIAGFTFRSIFRRTP